MPRIDFHEVSKTFGHTQVLQDFSAVIEDGEFLVLLGPSGCGKSTLLRMIAGLTDVTSGEIRFDGEVVNSWDVRRRHLAFVFQSYALYPQMTVRQNIAFPLMMDRVKQWHHLPLVGTLARRRLLRQPDLVAKVTAIAEQLELSGLLDRRPAKLSGGQRQRVALARSLVREPSAYLLDEPLSNLDAKLRTQMRSDITRMHRAVGKTFIYVTHDQIEAMTMATRIVVINDGLIQQIGTPEEIYDRPRNVFVATFVGSPPMNLIDGARLAVYPRSIAGLSGSLDGRRVAAVAGVRPEALRITALEPDLATNGAGPAAECAGLPAKVEVVERLGAETLIGCRLTDSVEDIAPPLVFARVSGPAEQRVGQDCCLLADLAAWSWFDPVSGERISAGGVS